MSETQTGWMTWADRVATRGWFGDALLLLLCGAVLALAALLSPTDEAVHLFGREIPAVCTWRNLFGFGCPGCGLTRSFSYMAHGAVLDAFRMNLFGPPMFLAMASQVPWRAWRLWRYVRGRVD